jgi:glycosyltransferase involved in cell wall biosynthesis
MVSVILTAYNAEKYIRDALESIVGQTYTNWELVIVDDASTDNTETELDEFNASHGPEKMTFVELDKNEGHTKALNIALKFAKGDYIAWQDADDISEPNRFEEQLKLIEDGADLVTTHGIAINEKGKRIKDAYTDNFQRRTQLEIKIHLETDCWLMLPSLMWKREINEKIGNFNENCVFSQDYEFFLRAINAGFRWDKCEMELYRLRRHAGQVRKMDKRSKERNWHTYAWEEAHKCPVNL